MVVADAERRCLGFQQARMVRSLMLMLSLAEGVGGVGRARGLCYRKVLVAGPVG